MNRAELQQLSDQRINDATALLAASCWSGGYYLAGYAVECALKSCVLLYVEQTGILFEDRKFAEKCWTHDLDTLLKQAGLSIELGIAISTNPQLGANWLMTKDWSEAARYRVSAQHEAEELFNSITDSRDGVLSWIKLHW